MVSKEQKILRLLKPKTHISTGKGDSNALVLPNHSGDHSRGTVTQTPVKDIDIANKKYVDDSTGAGGNDTEIQFNDAGALAGDAKLTWDKTNDVLTIDSTAGTGEISFSHNGSDAIIDASGTSAKSILVRTNGTNEGMFFDTSLGNIYAGFYNANSESFPIGSFQLRYGAGIAGYMSAGGTGTVNIRADSNLRIQSNNGGLFYIAQFKNDGNMYMQNADNQKIVLGAGNDATLYYDGTNLVIDPSEVGSGSLSLNSNKIINVTDPASDQDAATKKYVDDNVMKELFLPARFNGAGTASNAIVGDFLTLSCTSTEQALFTFAVPDNFTTLNSAVVVMIPDATETIQWDVDTDYGAAGQSSTTHSEQQLNQTTSATSGQLLEADVSGVLTSLAANDYVGLRFQSDTSNLRVVGLRIKYT